MITTTSVPQGSTTIMSATERTTNVARPSESAKAASASNGFDLINHAIRMGASPIGADASSLHQHNSDLLLNARLLERQRELVPIHTATGAATSSLSLHAAQHSHASAIVAAAARHASLVQQQQQEQQLIDGVGGLVAALQRRHQQNQRLSSLADANRAVNLSRSYLASNAAATALHHTVSTGPETQDEQNARQLNPNAFQFPWKLHDMLDRATTEGNDDVVSWVEGGEAFRVHLPDVFVANVMPRFFKQTKYKSFQRQLNLYGFTRLHNGPNKGGYKHKYFRQGQRTLCQLITRCPIRDSSSAAATTAAETEKEKIPKQPSVTDSATSSTSGVSNAPASSVLTQLKTEQLLLSQQPKNIIADVESMTRQEQQNKLQLDLRLHQLQAQRLHETKLQQDTPVITQMKFEVNDHSKLRDVLGRKVSITGSSTDVTALSSGNSQSYLDTSKHSAVSSQDGLNTDMNETTSQSTRNTSDVGKSPTIYPKEFQFPWKLYEMLQRADERNFSHFVSWMPENTCFKVHDVDNFVKHVMPSFFKQTKYKSFQRQLNLYGFFREDHGPCKGGYSHPGFIRGRKDLLPTIVRTKVKGNGRPRSGKGNTENGAGDTSNLGSSSQALKKPELDQNQAVSLNPSVNKEAANALPMSTSSISPGSSSGMDVILEAIRERERSNSEKSSSEKNRSNVVTDLSGDSDSSTIPSTIDVRMKDSSTADSKNPYGLSWRQHPSESYSDWTIEVVFPIDEFKLDQALYHVHRRVLAVGPKKSEYFASIFKSNGSANRNQLRLNQRQAAVFPMVLDYIYSDNDLDLDTEKAYALYGLGEHLENAAVIQAVTEYYFKWRMTKENVTDFIKLGQSFKDKSLLKAAVLKCSQFIGSMDVEKARNIDPDILHKVLILALAQDNSIYDSNRISEAVANCVSNATRITLTPEVFRSLTGATFLPTIEPTAAIKLLATENTLLSGVHGDTSPGDVSLHERCVLSIHQNWAVVRQRLAENNELANTMRSISSILLFDILMKTTSH